MSDEQQDSGKVGKQYDKNMNRLIAVLGGKSLLEKNPKLATDELHKAMEELTKEEKEKIVKSVKDKAVSLIQKKKDFDKMVIEKQKEMEKAINDKKKEFNKEAEGLFAMIDQMENLEKSYMETLVGMAKPDEPAKEADNNTEPV